jgi:hypothetical protein
MIPAPRALAFVIALLPAVVAGLRSCLDTCGGGADVASDQA